MLEHRINETAGNSYIRNKNVIVVIGLLPFLTETVKEHFTLFVPVHFLFYPHNHKGVTFSKVQTPPLHLSHQALECSVRPIQILLVFTMMESVAKTADTWVIQMYFFALVFFHFQHVSTCP